MAAKSFKPEYYVKAHQLARAGLSKGEVAKGLGVGMKTLKRWMKEVPAFADAVRSGREATEGAGAYEGLKEYAYHRLPPEVRKVWDEIDEIDDADEKEYPDKHARLGEIFRKLAARPERMRQQLFLHALVSTNFMITTACRKAGVSRDEVDNWCRHSPYFDELLAGVQEVKKDFFEGCLVGLCRRGDSGAIIFANRTINRNRGYGEKLTVSTTNRTEVTHRVRLDELPIEARRMLLQKHRPPEMIEEKISTQGGDTIDADFEEVVRGPDE